ncbi:hypothetical protein E0H47_27485 [Rhizobium leguminosarum bv. viciae]|uniref:hypothetical protein n=1 Tax=Rhizobium leguminosarum TaxID=384 RepID=UPI001037E4CE|nr:hypothetical protein [Rhizobium leguminosarum]TBG89355.1 hypothetical protein ELG67_09765 [Rhizobium leguminosarum]TBZ33413.1 hypothetical protein E0H47_27485 [Rhizobium leguminosarum bv. viciae]
MRTRILSVVTILSMIISSLPAHAEEPAIQVEAERTLTEIDCEIQAMSSDVERLGNRLRETNGKLKSYVSLTQRENNEAVREANELIEKTAEALIDKGLTLILGEKPSMLPKKRGRPSNAAKQFKVSEVIMARFALWKTNLDIAKGILKTVGRGQKMAGAQRKMLAVSRELDEYSQQLASAETAVKRLLDYRDSVEAAFTAKGAEVTGEFFGDACASSEMDGVWQTDNSENDVGFVDTVEIRGNRMKLTSGIPNVTEKCGIFQGTVSANNDGSATGAIQQKCQDDNMYFRFEFKLDGASLTNRYCEESYKLESCDSISNVFMIMKKIAD